MAIISALTGMFLGFGFLTSTEHNQNYTLITNLMPYFLWGYLFLSYGLTKLAQTLFRVRYCIKILVSAIGMWAWLYIFLSFTLFDSTPMAPTEILLSIPVVIELWSLTTTIHQHSINKSQKRRAKDA